MTDFKAIKGFNVKSLATDPLDSGAPNGVWSAGGNLNTGRQEMTGSGASQDSALAFGGDNGPGVVALTEAYNGTGWTEVADLNTARSLLGGTGLQGASLGIGGGTVNTELWNGSGWTEVNNLNTSKSNNSCAGITTAAISVGGGPDQQTQVELWDGTSWTETTEVNSAKNASASSGTSTATISAGGSPSGAVALTEIWNGSAWTEVADLNTARFQLNGFGLTTAALVFGGNTDTAMTANTEAWDGSAWAEVANFATATQTMGSSSNASNTNGASFGGIPNSVVTAEWTAGGIGDTIKNEGQIYYNSTDGTMNITAIVYGTGAWASGGNLNTARRSGGMGADSHSAAVLAGGTVARTELYNGSSWTEVNDLNTARTAVGAFGSSTSMLIVGGINSGDDSVEVSVEQWDGTNWTEIANINTGRYEGVGGSGTTTSGMIFGGKEPAQSAKTEIWNGSGWTEVNDLNTARARVGASTKGTVTATLCFGGNPNRAITESWDGTSWTEVADLNTARQEMGGAGTQASALGYAGHSGSNSALTEAWNGSSWTEVADLATARRHATTGNGSAVNAIQAGGETDAVVVNTEEWTVPETVTNQVMTD